MFMKNKLIVGIITLNVACVVSPTDTSTQSANQENDGGALQLNNPVCYVASEHLAFECDPANPWWFPSTFNQNGEIDFSRCTDRLPCYLGTTCYVLKDTGTETGFCE